MLQSLIQNPMPTKAEVSDITASVLAGASALMLSGETAVGEHPIAAVETMRKVADFVSKDLMASLEPSGTRGNIPDAVSEAIDLICRRIPVTKIVAITVSGFAARMIAAKSPRQPILAVSNDRTSASLFNLYFGTEGVHVDVPFSRTSMDHIPLCLEALWKLGKLLDDDFIVVTAVGYPKSGNRMNLIELHKVADLRDNLNWRR
jgi:pyruvate kinase